MGAYRGDQPVREWIGQRQKPVRVTDEQLCLKKLTKHAVDVLMTRPTWADTSEMKDLLKDYAAQNYLYYNSDMIGRAMDAARRGICHETVETRHKPNTVRLMPHSNHRRWRAGTLHHPAKR